VDPLEVKRVISSGDNVLIDLKIRDGEKVRQYLAMVKDYQLHPVKDQLWHVDFYEISLQEEIEVEVPLALVGEPVGVKMGGLLNPLLRSLEIACLPSHLPEHLEVDCSSLQIGESLHVSDLTIPEGVRVKTDPSTPVVTVLAPEAEEAVEEEGAEREEWSAGSEGSGDE
jgi:large subunit ribosomal protein L25